MKTMTTLLATAALITGIAAANAQGATKQMDEQAGGNSGAVERNPDGSTVFKAENVEVPIREYFPFIKPPLLDEIASFKIAMGGLLPDAGPKYPSELSGGMVKRAGLARARLRGGSDHRTNDQ